MSIFLLDVNVLLTLHLSASSDHAKTQRWFKAKGSRSFATCAVTQAGFVRVAGQLAVKDRPLELKELQIALGNLISQSNHKFWPMDIPLLQAIEKFESRIHGHRQITDAYLLGLAMHHGGKLATLDRGVLHLAGPEFQDSVELIA